MIKLTPPTKAFIGIAVVFTFSIIFFIYLGIENMWFDNSKEYKTKLSEADGLRSGTLVTLSGLRVGEVVKLKVDDDNKIIATFKVKSSLAHKIKEGTVVHVVRSFVIGDKRLDISPGPKENASIPEGGIVPGIESFEIADLLSGKKVGEIMGKLDSLINAVNALSMVGAKVKPEELVALYQLILPTVKKLNQVLVNADGVLIEVAKEKNAISPMLRNSSSILAGTDKIIKPIAANEKLIKDMVGNLALLTEEVAKDPQLAKKMLTALNETIVTLKAIQRTWMLSSHVKAVEEESKKDKEVAPQAP
ncbi:MAG: MlaD family protein [Bacteriovoracaceae bacterium]